MKTTMTPEERRRREALLADERRFDALLQAALRVPVDASAGGQPQAAPRPRPRWPAFAAVAASMLLAAGLWLGLQGRPATDVSPLGAEIVAHILHEPASLAVTASTVPAQEFDEVLRRGRAGLTQPVGSVSYAKLCPFRGEMVAHFVVQGEKGPVTVMLLPHEEVNGPTPIDEEGFVGTIVPMEGGGSAAIVGTPDEDIEIIRDRLQQAVRWRL
jgi:hypothetical protein